MKSRTATAAETGHRIEGFARTAESVSVNLLDAIDGTVETMLGLTKIMSGLSDVIHSTAAEIDGLTGKVVEGDYIDQDDKAIDATRHAASILKDFLTQLVRKRSAIDKDARLKEHHSEALHDAYEEATGAVAELIESLDAIRAAIISHDLKAEPRGDAASYDTVTDLITSLRQ